MLQQVVCAASVWALFGSLLTGFSGRAAALHHIRSSQDLQAAMYLTRQDQVGCIRLLHASGVSGCASSEVAAPLQRLNSSGLDPQGDRVLLLEAQELPQVLADLHTMPDPYVKGILVENAPPAGALLAASFPLAAFAPYAAEGYKWNPKGMGLSKEDFSVPIVQLDKAAAVEATRRANENELKGFKGALHTALVDAQMEGEHNSTTCLAADKCDPLGGHSVWAALPPFPPTGDTAPKPAILVLSGIDGQALFHDAIVGADAPLSGLVATLTAAEILGNSSQAGNHEKRVIFLALAGEPWGYMGSKRFLWELQSGENSTAGLTLETIEQVLEIGQVGRAATDSSARSKLFFHAQQGPDFGDVQPLWNALNASASPEVSLSRVSSSNPGIPPSSLMSFLRANNSIAGAVLVEFDSQFTNPYFWSEFDTAEGINTKSIAAAATVAAKGLHTLAFGAQSPPPLQVDQAAVEARVNELLGCLAANPPFQDCPLADNLFTRAGQASNYIGVLHTLTSDSQDPNAKSDVSRFVWNFLAAATSAGPAQLASGESGGCDYWDHPCQAGAVCQGFRYGQKRQDGNGRCVFATARYVPSYSTRLECQNCTLDAWGPWVVTNASRAWEEALGWPPDPMWTESRWSNGVPRLQLYQKESERTETAILLAGVSVTFGSALLMYIARVAYAKHTKQS